jgi:hypothetical protein
LSGLGLAGVFESEPGFHFGTGGFGKEHFEPASDPLKDVVP